MTFFTFLIYSNIVLQPLFIRFADCAKFSPTGRQTLTDEERLNDIIFQNYDPSFRPVYNASEAVEIIFGLNLITISKMDEITQILELTVWLEMYWKDKRLTWSPPDFSGLEMVRLPTKMLWSPDVVLYNSADEFRISGEVRAMVAHTGEIFAGPYVKIRSTCILDLTLYPFDDQTCRLIFGSWSYDISQLILTASSQTPVLTQYIESAVWDLLDSKIDEKYHFYSCCKHPFSVIIVTIQMRRRFLLNNLLNIFIPTCWLMFLTLLTFWLDPASGEKITLCITILVTFTLFQILVQENTPRTSDYFPLISLYLESCYITTGVVVGLQVFILNLHGLSPILIAVPHWLRVLVLSCFARCLCVNVDVDKKPGAKSKSKGGKSKSRQSSYRGSYKGSSKGGSYKGTSQSTSKFSSVRRTSSAGSFLFTAGQHSALLVNPDTMPGPIVKEDNLEETPPDFEQGEPSSASSSTLQLKMNHKQKSETIYVGLEEILDELHPRSHERFLRRDATTPYQNLSLPHLTLVPAVENDGTEIAKIITPTSNGEEALLINKNKPPNNVKFYINDGASLLVLNEGAYQQMRTPPPPIMSRSGSMEQSPGSPKTSPGSPKTSPGSPKTSPPLNKGPAGQKGRGTFRPTARSRFEKELLQRLLRSVGYMVKREQSSKMTELVVAEWRMIAFVLDRLLFWAFAIFTVSFIVAFLFGIPISEHAMHNHNESILVRQAQAAGQ